MAKCKGCGREIEWIEHMNPLTGEVKKIPLDPSAPTYEFHLGSGSGTWLRSAARVSHFATCPKANDFSASKKTSMEQLELPPAPKHWTEECDG